jgi:hypothetical protein
MQAGALQVLHHGLPGGGAVPLLQRVDQADVRMLGRGLRINAVSPTLLTESAEAYGSVFPGFETVPAARVALAYQRSVEGAQTGKVFEVI